MKKIDIHTHILPPELPKFKDMFGYGGFIQLQNCTDCSDIEMLDATIKQFQQLEQEKTQVLRPAEQELKWLADATNIEVNDLDKIMTEMRSLARLGQLRMPQLNAIVQQLTSLLQMGGAKKHGMQQAQDIITKVRNTDRRLKEIAGLYRKLQADVLIKLGRGVGGRSKQALTAINRIRI